MKCRLTRELCQRCLAEHGPISKGLRKWDAKDERRWWLQGKIPCFIMPSKPTWPHSGIKLGTLISICREMPPDNCWYAVEHIASRNEADRQFNRPVQCVYCGATTTHREVVEQMQALTNQAEEQSLQKTDRPLAPYNRPCDTVVGTPACFNCVMDAFVRFKFPAFVMGKKKE